MHNGNRRNTRKTELEGQKRKYEDEKIIQALLLWKFNLKVCTISFLCILLILEKKYSIFF